MENQNKKFLPSTFWMVSLIVILGFTAYASMLSSGFKTMDENFTIVINPDIKSFSNIGKIFMRGFFDDAFYYRPLVTLSHMVEYSLFGLNPFFYNLSNIGIHLLVGLCIFFLVSSLLKERWFGFLGALLFVIHPVQWEAVSNISGRAILLCTLFYVSAFYLFHLFISEKRNVICYGASIGMFILALLSKESAATFPLVAVSYIYFLAKQQRISLKEGLKKVLPFFLVLFFYLAWRNYLGLTQAYYWDSLKNALLGGVTFLRIVITYLRILVWPKELYFDRAQKLFDNFVQPELIWTVAFFCASAFILWKIKNKLTGEILFFLSWFCIGLLTVSQILPISVQAKYLSAAEHFLYLPSIGFFAAIVIAGKNLFDVLLQKKIISMRSGRICIVGLYIFLWLLSVQQNIYASNDISMFKQSIAQNPRNVRMQYSLGWAYVKRGLFKEGERHFRQALKTDPLSAIARISLGKVLCDQGRYFEGVNEYEKVVTDEEKYKKLLEDNLKLSYPFLIRQYQDALSKDPDNAALFYSLGVIYSKSGRIPEAIESYEKAVSQNPGNNQINQYAHYHLGLIYERLGDPTKSKDHFKKSSEILSAMNAQAQPNIQYSVK